MTHGKQLEHPCKTRKNIQWMQNNVWNSEKACSYNPMKAKMKEGEGSKWYRTGFNNLLKIGFQHRPRVISTELVIHAATWMMWHEAIGSSNNQAPQKCYDRPQLLWITHRFCEDMCIWLWPGFRNKFSFARCRMHFSWLSARPWVTVPRDCRALSKTSSRFPVQKPANITDQKHVTLWRFLSSEGETSSTLTS